MAESDARIECPYPDCDKDYSDQGYLDNHIESKHSDEVDEDAEAADEVESEPEEAVEEAPEEETPEETCDNHPDREAVWESDGVTANVVRYCNQCKGRYT